MPKHKARHEIESDIKFVSFSRGLNEEVSSRFLSRDELSKCVNFKYGGKFGTEGTVTTLRLRQGTEKISNTALSGGAAVKSATYYMAQSKYVLATASKLYYLDASYDPVEIGNLDGIPTFTEFAGKLIVHDSGITKAWDGTTLETLYDRYDDVTIGTGNGEKTNFTGTLAYPAVLASSVTIEYLNAGGDTLTITDDGSGNLIGDVDDGGTNTVTYATGEYDFTCSEAPADGTDITITYGKSQGAPKSKAGLVRGGRLYLWGSEDYPSRLFYTGTNDEYAFNSTSGGGFLDVNADDGQSITGCVNFYQTMLVVKTSSLHRLDNFPGDDTFRAEPIADSMGANAYRTVLEAQGIVSMLNADGWNGLSASERFGDVQSSLPLSKNFQTIARKYANSYAMAEYFPTDKQLWLGLYDTSANAPHEYVYVLSVPGAQLSKYRFAFDWSCFKYVNSEMLIGSTDGNLYRMNHLDRGFEDDSVSYSANSYFSTGDIDMELPYNRKHCKYTQIYIYGRLGYECTVNFYKDYDSSPFLVLDIETGLAVSGYEIFSEGPHYEIYDMDGEDYGISPLQGYAYAKRTRFNYSTLRLEFTGVFGYGGVEISGITMKTAELGR